MDLRVGTILSAEKMPKANKLLVLTVDVGVDQRTIVSGIAEHFQPGRNHWQTSLRPAQSSAKSNSGNRKPRDDFNG